MIKQFKMKILLLISILFIVLNSAFAQTADVKEGCAPLTVNFTAPNNTTGYFWDFKDGASSNLQNPSNTFTKSGVFTVELRSSTTGPVIGTVKITIYNKPVPNFTANTPLKGCSPLTVSLTGKTDAGAGVTVSEYTWTFGEGSGASGKTVSNKYNDPGVYDISVGIVTNLPTCNGTAIYPKKVSVSNPIPSFDASPSSACVAPLTVSFTNNSIGNSALTYDWDLGNGQKSTDKTPPNQTYTKIGVFPIKLKIKDTNGCEKTMVKNVVIGSPISSFQFPDTVCINSAHTAVNLSSQGFYLWKYDVGSGQTTSTDPNPTIGFPKAGKFTINLKTTSFSGLCSKDTSISVVVEDPKISIKSLPTYSCGNPTTFNLSVVGNVKIKSYNWAFTQHNPSTAANPSITYNLKDVQYHRREVFYAGIGVQVTTTNGCVASASLIDTIYPVFARFMPDKVEGCAPLKVTFSDSTLSREKIVSYAYDFGDGQKETRTTDADFSHTFNNPGIYKVVLKSTNTLGCFDISDTIFIKVGNQRTLDFTLNKSSICPGESVKFTNTTANQNLFSSWNVSTKGELTSHCYADKSPTLMFNDSVGSFDVTLSADYNGCRSTVTKTGAITVKGPIAKFNYTYSCAKPLEVNFKNQSQGFTNVSWDFGDGNTSTSSANINHVYAASGNYFVKITATNSTSGCAPFVFSDTIKVRKIKANFTAPKEYCLGGSFTFDGSSSVDVDQSDYRGYSWVFSDPSIRPNTTEFSSATLNFKNSGAQKISLVVRDVNGCVDTLTKNIVVYQLKPTFTLTDSSICMPMSVKFTNTSVGDTTLVSQNWDFGDGTNSSAASPTKKYSTFNAGEEIPVTLTVTDKLGCTGTAFNKIKVYKPVSSLISPTTLNSCAGIDVNFQASDFTSEGSKLKYVWNFGDGKPTSTVNPVKHKFTPGGAYTVNLVYTEIATGCKDSLQQTINIQDFPKAAFTTTADGKLALCDPAEVTFTDQSTSATPITSLQWKTSIGQNSTNSSPVFVFKKGKHTAKLIVSTSFGCKDSVTRTFQVYGPKGNFDADVTTICKGDKIKFTIKDTSDVNYYEWDFGDGRGAAQQSPVSHPYTFIPPSGKTEVKLTVYGDTNLSCPVVIQKTINIREVRALFDRNDKLDTIMCLGEKVTLTNKSTGADTYNWSFGDGKTSTSAGPILEHTYTKANTYTIQLIVANKQYGCKDTLKLPVIVYDYPKISTLGDTVCEGKKGLISVNYTGVNPVQIKWTPKEGLSNDTVVAPIVSTTKSTDYIVKVLDPKTTCVSIDTVPFIVIPKLKNTNFDTSIVIGDKINLPVDIKGGLFTLEWTPEEGLSCTQCSNPIIGPLEDITYSLKITDINNCSQATWVYTIKIIPETFIDVPTTFTPNGDGTNDKIYVVGWGVKDLIFFQIFNRWGELVFETSEMNEGWDGYYKGILQNNETYTFKAKAQTYRDEVYEKQGYINLMR